MDVIDEMELGNQVLDKLYYLDPSSIIAGGAPRDWYFDKNCSDIDVYFYYRPDISTTTVKNILGKIFDVDMKLLGSSMSHDKHEHRYLRDDKISNVWEFDYLGKTVQLIRRNIPTFGVTNSFALNLSMIWFKGNQINPEEHFLTGVKNKSIVKMNPLYLDGDKYVQKIKNKFPTYKYFSDEMEFYKYFAKVNSGV
jgi:hypothetical protein